MLATSGVRPPARGQDALAATGCLGAATRSGTSGAARGRHSENHAVGAVAWSARRRRSTGTRPKDALLLDRVVRTRDQGRDLFSDAFVFPGHAETLFRDVHQVHPRARIEPDLSDGRADGAAPCASTCPNGDHRVVLALVPTRTRRGSLLVSIASALAAAAAMVFSHTTGSESAPRSIQVCRSVVTQVLREYPGRAVVM